MSAAINDHIRRRAGKLPATAAPKGAQGAQADQADPADPDAYLAALAAVQADSPDDWDTLSVAVRAAAQTYATVLAVTTGN